MAIVDDETCVEGVGGSAGEPAPVRYLTRDQTLGEGDSVSATGAATDEAATW